MSTIYYDPDEWEPVFTHEGSGSGLRWSYSERRRSPEEVAKVKSEKRRIREDAILAAADQIRRARASTGEEQ